MTKTIVGFGMAMILAACDSSSTPDAGNSIDASVDVDAAVATADAPSGDAGAKTCAANYASCTTFTDLTAMTTVMIATGPGLVYTPNCIKVKQGTTINIQGSSTHPLSAASCSPTDFVNGGASGVMTTANYTVGTTGIFGFFCKVHGADNGNGMAGAIQVVP